MCLVQSKLTRNWRLQELADAPVMSYDPLPPPDSIDLYSPEARRGGGAGRASLEDEGGLALFFR